MPESEKFFYQTDSLLSKARKKISWNCLITEVYKITAWSKVLCINSFDVAYSIFALINYNNGRCQKWVSQSVSEWVWLCSFITQDANEEYELYEEVLSVKVLLMLIELLTVHVVSGKRLCSAETFARQNMFLLFSAMLQHFSVRSPAGHPLPDLEQHEPGINLSSKPFSVQFVPR